MKVSKAVNYFIDYHKINSKKKYNKESSIHTIQVPESLRQQEIGIHNHG